MPSTLAAHARRALFFRRLLLSAAALLAGSQILAANTSVRIQPKADDGCYCHCAESRSRDGCTKMCELPKYAARWWATTCVKPRHHYSPLPNPANPGASPRLPHPDRAEHARL
jgi:hypothetical protein